MSSNRLPIKRKLYLKVRSFCGVLLFYFFRLFPLQKKIVATSFRGKKYGDNSQYIIEELHKIDPSLKIIWLKDRIHNYTLPDFITPVPFYSCIRKAYEMATAMTWIDSHLIEPHIRKRKGQLFIETWHGGLGIKKIQQDVKTLAVNKEQLSEIKITCKSADLFISNSSHLTNIYRKAFQYTGKIWQCGYPKNDILVNKEPSVYMEVRDYFNLSQDTHIFLYAPTFRNITDKNLFDLNWIKIKSTLEQFWGNKWVIILRWHPKMAKEMADFNKKNQAFVLNGTFYPDMQKLILASNAFLSDYSSCIFDAALCQIPCFTYAPDYAQYKTEQGVYYELGDLPFPFAECEQDLIENIKSNPNKLDESAWKLFAKKTNLTETGHAAKEIATVIKEFMAGNKKILDQIPNV